MAVNIVVLFVIILLISFYNIVVCEENCSTACGHVRNISYPFRVKGDPEHCGDQRYEIDCDNKVPIVSLFSGKYFVKHIDYKNYTIRLIDPGFAQAHSNSNCSLNPLYFLSKRNFRYGYSSYKCIYEGNVLYSPSQLVYLRCREAVNDPFYVNVTSTTTSSSSVGCNSSINNIVEDERSAPYNYAFMGHYYNLLAEDVRVGCHVRSIVLVDWDSEYHDYNYYRDGVNSYSITFKYVSYSDIHTRLLHGFTLSWLHGVCKYYCQNHSLNPTWCLLSSSTGQLQCDDGYCGLYTRSAMLKLCGFWRTLRYYVIYVSDILLALPQTPNWLMIPAMLHALKVALGTPCVIILLFYKWCTRHRSMYENIEEFLQSNNTLMPIKYSYKDIKNMTHGFKDKLGEGGFGAVFKRKTP